jgi:hypothetical protein
MKSDSGKSLLYVYDKHFSCLCCLRLIDFLTACLKAEMNE